MDILRSIPRKLRKLRTQFILLCALVVVIIILNGSMFWGSSPKNPISGSAGRDPYSRREDLFDLDIHEDTFHHGNQEDGLHAARKEEEDEDSFLYRKKQGGHQHHNHGVTDSDKKNTIALGCAVTSRNVPDLTVENLPYRIPFLKTLLPSFCNTASAGFEYHFYVSFDVNDPNLGQKRYLNAFYERFVEVRGILCPAAVNVSLHFVQCSHNHNPAWAQNDAMMEAYLDDMEFYYRLNDDTHLLSPGWTESYVEALQAFEPPCIGVVGPAHRGGNEYILTYDFVHKTHLDIFGYYYPRLFTDWWADDWITTVYGAARTQKLPGVKVKHTQEAGTRYRIQWNNEQLLQYQLLHDKRTLDRYILSKKNPVKVGGDVEGKKVVSMSLWGSDPRYTFGAIRNAQLMSVFFHGWLMRVYIEKPYVTGRTRYPAPSDRLVQKLASLGAEVIYVDISEVAIPPMLWRFLVADDKSVAYFIVRDADARLCDRDATVVDDWVRSGAPVHCVRDHPSHVQYSLSGGLWGAKPKELQQIIPIPWKNLMMGHRDAYGADMSFLSNMVWPKVKQHIYCHDSYSCKEWPGAHPFPIERRGTEHVGQVFDAFGYARDEDMRIIRESSTVPECVTHNTTGFTQINQVANKPESKIDELGKHVALVKEAKESADKFEAILTADMQYNKDTENNRNQNQNQKDDGNVNNSSSGADVSGRGQSTPPTKRHNNITVIWSMDFHTSPIRDIKNILKDSSVKIIDKSLSGHCRRTASCANNLRVVTRDNGMHLTPEFIDEFYNEYVNDPEMNLVTHFVCSFPPSMCELYTKFNRHVIVYVTGRYEHAHYDRTAWQAWNSILVKISTTPGNLIAANNVYDALYLKHFTGIQPHVIPSLCSYVNAAYLPRHKEFLVAPVLNPNFQDVFLKYFYDKSKKLNATVSLIPLRRLYFHYNFTSLASHPGIVHIPYQISTYSFCEQYYMNIPLFVPSLELLVGWHLKYDVMGQLTFNDVRRVMGESKRESPVAGMGSLPDPNMDKNATSVRAWLKHADFYHRPHVVQFNSVGDLIEKLQHTDLKDVSRKMSVYNQQQSANVTKQWINALDLNK